MNKLPVEMLDSFSPPDIQVTFYLSKVLTLEQEEYLERIIVAWYDVGVHGGYEEGCLHNMDEISFDEEQTICLSIDMGSCTPKTLEVLFKIVIDALKSYEVQIDKIEIG